MNRTTLQLLIACLLSAAVSAQNVMVTFRVDLSKVAGPAIQGAHFAGAPNSWSPQAMVPLGGGQFEIALSVPENSSFEYKFLDGPNNFEPGTDLVSCGTPNGNRSLTVGTADIVLPNTCFGKCTACQSSLFVSVDMSSAGPVGPSGVFVSTASGLVALTDGGSGTWSGAITAPSFSVVEYLFVNGAAGEPVADLSACGNADGAGGFVRSATLLSDDQTVPTACFGRCGGCPKPCATDPDALLCENFNGLALGPVGPQVTHFSGQNGVDGGPEDPSVSAAQSSDGGQSLRISGDNTGGAVANSTVLRLGNLASGKFDLTWKMFFPTGHTGFFNIDSDEAGFGPMVTVVTSPSGDVFLVGGNGEAIGKLQVPSDSWVDFRLLADVSGHVAQLRIGQNFAQNIAFGSQLGGLNFSGIAPNTEFFVDEIELRKNALFAVNLDDCPMAFDLSPYLSGASPTLSTPLFDNSLATAEAVNVGVDCFTEDDFGGTEEVQNSLWYKFEGNGRTYQVQTAPCGAGAEYLDGGDTQMAAYTGPNCASLTSLGCNDDIGFQFVGDFRSGLVIASELNKSYRILVDGFDGTTGKFCLQFTQFQRVTFQVDAANIAPVNPQGLFIQGSWDGWAAPHAMLPVGGSLWKYTIDMPPGAIIEWKYQNGPGGWEPDAALGACGTANPFGGFNRVATVAADIVLPVVCFGSCDTCAIVGTNDDCAFAEDISSYFGKGLNVVSTTPTYDNSDATAGADDPTSGYGCFNEGDGPLLSRTTFYKFTGDGKMYRITTVPCDATGYITGGDSQMAVYAGGPCQFGTSVACNDDLYLFGEPDYRASVQIQTTAGQPYTIMIDGWGDSQGEFCIEVVEISPLGCGAAMIGEPESEETAICFGDFSFLLINEANTVVPNVGPVSGFGWVETTSPIPAGWTGTPAGFSGFTAGLPLSALPYSYPAFNSPMFTPGVRILTPVLVSGATATPGGTDPFDLDGGCFIFGLPVTLTYWPDFDPIAATGAITHETAPNNGSIALTVTGGSGTYAFTWSNGSSAQNLTGLAAGDYTVTVTDATGCVEDEQTFSVQQMIATGNLPGVSALSVFPNPTGGPVRFSIQLVENQAVSVRLVNALGQVLGSRKFAEGEKAEGSFDLSSEQGGVFFLRFEFGGRTAERKIVLVK